jgi:hypothetical protein
MHVSAQDAAGNGAESAPGTVHIDNAAPGAVPVGVEVAKAGATATNTPFPRQTPPEPDRPPIVAAQYRSAGWAAGVPEVYVTSVIGRCPRDRPDADETAEIRTEAR